MLVARSCTQVLGSAAIFPLTRWARLAVLKSLGILGHRSPIDVMKANVPHNSALMRPTVRYNRGRTLSSEVPI